MCFGSLASAVVFYPVYLVVKLTKLTKTSSQDLQQDFKSHVDPWVP